MKWNSESRWSLAFLPLTLLLSFVLPYAFFVERFRVLVWVWENAYLPFWGTLGVIALLAFVSMFLIYRLWSGVLYLYAAGIFITIAQPSYLAMREHRHALLVLIFLLLLVQVFFFEHLRRVLALPFYRARRDWWEVYPKALPNLHAEVYFDEQKTSCRVGRLSNFGESGCFVFFADAPLKEKPKFVEIKSGDSTLLKGPVETLVCTDDGFGCGLRFLFETAHADTGKDLRDYLSYLRRSGYVEG